MPFPAILVGAAAISAGVFGAGKSIKAGVDMFSASNLNKDANDLVATATEGLNVQRDAVKIALEALGREKLTILDGSLAQFLATFRKIKNVDFRDSVGLDELSEICIDEQDINELESLVVFATSVTEGMLGGALSGAFMAFGAYSAAQTFAAASTGTAIASLSGAAATNATLAFFGGGSLAAGGLGMAGGTIVLGSLVAGPALMVLGLVAGGAADKELEKARINSAQAQEIFEQASAAALQCEAIRRRTYMLHGLLARLEARFLPLVFALEDIFEREGDDYRLYSADAKKTVGACASIAVSIKTVLDTPMLDDDGILTEESDHLVDKMLRQLG